MTQESLIMSAQLEKRLRQELRNFQNNPPDGITAGLDDEDLLSWTATMAGPDGSPYAGGIFFLQIECSLEYPQKPPRIRFMTKVYHPNVSSEDGLIYVDILERNWCPALTIEKLLLSIQSLLTDPNAKDAAEPEIADEYINNREMYDETAWEWTKEYAMG